MSILRSIAISTLALSLAQPAIAQKQERKGKPVDASAVISKHDKDKDGKLSLKEVEGTHLAKAFARLDKNKDGFLSAEEVAAGRKGSKPAKEEKRGKKRKQGKQK